MTDEGLLAAARSLVGDASTRDPWLFGLRVAGIGWATVELERAAGDLAAAFARAGMPEPRWTPAPRDELLGAMAWVSREWWPAEGLEVPPAVVLLEPDTEGRLAATLARFGEGVGVAYLARAAAQSNVVSTRLGLAAGGPLGAARLVLARPTWGPNLVVLDR
jgi:hypothetical protein